MKRFNCPSCGRSLWLRLLPFVQLSAGQFRFSCSYCGTVLTYNTPQPLIEGPQEKLRGARLRAIIIFLAGIVLFSVIRAVLGRVFALAALAVVTLVLIAFYLFSPAPAYKIADRESPGAGSKP